MSQRYFLQEGILVSQVMAPTAGNRLNTSIPNCEIGVNPYTAVIDGYGARTKDADLAMDQATRQLGAYVDFHHKTPTATLLMRPPKIFTSPRFKPSQVVLDSVKLVPVPGASYQHFNPHVYGLPIRNETGL